MLPKFNEFFPSVMNYLNDSQVHSFKEIVDFIINDMQISKEDAEETLQSGKTRLKDRVGWAKTYLVKAGLIDVVSYGKYKITNDGVKAVKKGSKNITLDYLEQFESFRKFRSSKTTNKSNNTDEDNNEIQNVFSPQEIIENALNDINTTLSDDLMREIMKIDSYDFEKLVVKLLIKMGYGTLELNSNSVTQKSGDEGIDGVVTSDKFGFDSVYIQAKRWKQDKSVGRPEVQKFLGALAGQGATKGLFITTANFTKDAIDFANKHLHSRIVLVNGNSLCKLLIEYNLGVSTVETYYIKKVDLDFFNDEM